MLTRYVVAIPAQAYAHSHLPRKQQTNTITKADTQQVVALMALNTYASTTEQRYPALILHAANPDKPRTSAVIIPLRP